MKSDLIGQVRLANVELHWPVLAVLRRSRDRFSDGLIGCNLLKLPVNDGLLKIIAEGPD